MDNYEAIKKLKETDSQQTIAELSILTGSTSAAMSIISSQAAMINRNSIEEVSQVLDSLEIIAQNLRRMEAMIHIIDGLASAQSCKLLPSY